MYINPCCYGSSAAIKVCMDFCIQLKSRSLIWVAVKELKLNYYIGESLLFNLYTNYGNLI